MLKKLIAFVFLFASIAAFAQTAGAPAQSNYPVSSIAVQQAGTTEVTVNGAVTLNFTSGCTVTGSGSTASIACSGGSGSGTVTSVSFTGDGIFDSSTASTAVTTSGTVTATAIAQAANCIFGGPSSGISAAPSCRTLVLADLPAEFSGTPAAGTVLNATSTSAAAWTPTVTLGVGGTTAGSLTVDSGVTSGNGIKIADLTGITTLGTNENLLLEPNGTGAIVVNAGLAGSPTFIVSGTSGAYITTALWGWSDVGTSTVDMGNSGLIVSDNKALGFSQSTTSSGALGASFGVVGTGVNESLQPTSNGTNIPMNMSAVCKITAPISLTSATTICSFNLPSSAVAWGYQCQGTYSTSASSITLTLGTQFSNAPTVSNHNAIIWSASSTQTYGTAANAGTTAVTTLTGAAVSSGTNIPWQASGSFTNSATGGTFVIYGTPSTSGDATIAAGSTCLLY